MRVRHLQSHLQDQALVHSGKLDSLRGVRVGVDAVFWLRSIQALKDPFADALGGIPPGIFGFVDKELESFKRHDITPLFVFQGVAPGPQHSMFVSRMDTQMEAAWTFLAKGQKSEAQKCFAVSTSRINGDFVYFIFHHLRNKGYECLNAPYFAGAQLAHFAEQGVVQTVFGPPGLLLYGVQRVVIHINFAMLQFDWVDLESVLQKWQITRDQFVDACMLAGTEYCLTYPYLNLGHFQPAAPGRFNFEAAVYIIKQAPLINWMQTFPTEEMKNDHVDGYCICKVLVQNSPVLHLTDHVIRPLGAGTPGNPPPQVPFDFSSIMGEKLPNSLYYLMLNGIISHKLPQALAKGEWTDKSQPLVDTREFRDLLVDLQDYRETALGLIARHLHGGFQKKKILCKAFFESHPIRNGNVGNEAALPQDARIIQPKELTGLKWNITKDAVEAEMRRQDVDRVDFKFCLNWHAHECQSDGPLIQGITECGFPTSSSDTNSLAALVHLMVLEHLELIVEGEMTVFGNVLKDTPKNLQESCLVALEMMKFGVLSGEPFDAADRKFPEQVNYPTAPVQPRMKAVLLLSRVMSLVPMKLKNDMWNAEVDFDLAAFHSLVRILKRALRHLVEASLASILLKDLGRVRLLPHGFMCASPKKEDHLQTPAVLPTFMLPRACMGIVVRHFLDYRGDPREFPKDIAARFPCCVQPLEDLRTACDFWEDLRRCVDLIAEQLNAQELSEEMRLASEVLYDQKRKLLVLQ
mmetsp:Transcript_9268/g.25991  ORF Transcript_9268/g.25991 Transcript_9268/m.25991 type:complete len:748 (-) Transcript_9268:242-2485(-)|eukprot:CAMPEP_0179141566 /NCGR_PEP_ID=MMETSP0796-20121207/67912_1 /TAXON_ID=73915 /ORGANISM="Pyrodinium bahamense, Strain pbaha01" /LENGTH=747 /DNA_ID=CAMNT_0020841313 /DNA_START=25 /DNA_END=2268 /DNA_ORIENTATION=+